MTINLNLRSFAAHSAISSLRKIILSAPTTFSLELDKEAEKRNGGHSGDYQPWKGRRSLTAFFL